MIHAYHEAGISVVMDVVYNHIYSTEDGAFQTTVPDYYYRMNPNGSFKMVQELGMRRPVSMRCTTNS